MREVYLSNQLEALAESLKKNFLTGSSPFQKQMIVVPGLAIKNYLSLSFAQDARLKVFAGVRLCVLSEALALFFTECDKKIPKFLELSLLIEQEIYHLIESKDKEIQEIEHLFSSQKQITYLSDQLSRLFLHYGIFCEGLVQKWEKDREPGWQQKIWCRLFSSESPWSYSAALVKEVRGNGGPLHLFGFSFLPKLYFQLFKRLKSHFYLLSPCRFFWSDLYSDAQRIHLYKKMRALGVKEEEKCAADLYFKSENRLLANFGKMGREFALIMEEEECITEENYIESGESFLNKIQNDLLNLETSKESADRSFQVFAAGSKLHEMEMLVENLIKLMQEDPSITPKDVLILSPNIDEYLSFIHFVFPKELNYKINQIEMKSESLFAQGLLHLLNLPTFRFEAWALLKLLTLPPFLQKQGWAYKEVATIKKWVKDANIQWAINAEQKELFLKKGVQDAEKGTWVDGIERLLENLTSAHEKRDSIEFSDAILLGKWAELIFSLNEELRPILEGKEEYLSFWIEWFKRIADTYFVLSEEEMGLFYALDELLSKVSLSLSMKLRFESFKRIISHLLEERGASFHGTHIQAVTFSSLNSGNIFPAKVIYLMGMQEEAFPRKESTFFFSFLRHRQGLDYCPTKAEEDRWLFLELLLSARSYLWVSYLNKDPRDGKSLSPSALIEDLSSQYAIQEKRHFSTHPIPSASKPSHFFPEFQEERPFTPCKKEKELIIDIKQLTLLARHPIRFYMNRTLGIYLEKEEEEKEFTLSPLHKAILRQNSLKEEALPLIEEADRTGKLPQGIFKKIAHKRILNEIKERDGQLEQLKIVKEELFSVQLKSTCKSAYHNAQGELFSPPLKIALPEERVAYLIGSIEGLSSQGILFHGKDTLSDLVKVWPLFLISQLLPFEQEPAILFTKSGERRLFSLAPLETLQKYIAYYELACANVSPLLPDWASALLQGEIPDLEKAIRSTDQSIFLKDPYLEWLFSRDPLPSASLLFHRWAPFLRDVYAEL